METDKVINRIEETITNYNNSTSTMDSVTKAVMKEIGFIDLRKEVEDAYGMNDLSEVLFVPGMEDDYPVTLIEYDEASESVWLKYYVADVYDEKALKDNDNYNEDELQYFDEETKINVLKKIREYLENISK